MQKIDIAIIVLGVVVLASAVTGAVLYEPDTRARTWNVDWNTDTTSLDPKSDSVGASGGTVSLEFDVTQLNVTQGTFSTTVQAGSGHVSQDEIVVNVTAPNGKSSEDSTTLAAGASQTTLEVDVGLASVPTVATVQATNRSAALAMLAEDHLSRTGTGTWFVNVTVNHGGAGIAGTHDIQVTPTVGTYAATVTQATPDVRAP